MTESPATNGTQPTPRERTFTWADPMETVAAAAGRPGIDVLRDIASGVLPPPPIASLLPFDLTVIEPGYAEVSFVPSQFHYNPHAVVHGGVYAVLLDSAAGCAVQTMLPAGMEYTSLDLNIKFLRRMTVDTGGVRAMGTVTHFGKQTALVEARLVNAKDRLLATATSSCLVFRQAAP